MADDTWLDELRRLHEAGTAAPWRAARFGAVIVDGTTLRSAGARWLTRAQVAHVTGIPDEGLPVDHVDRNARLIVAARNALPRLLAIAEAARHMLALPIDVPDEMHMDAQARLESLLRGNGGSDE